MAAEVHVGDIGTIFRVTVVDENDNVVDLSSASTKQIIFKKPNNDLLTKDGTFYTDGTDGILQYTSISGDLSAAGVWNIQVYVILSTNEYRTNIASFRVYRNL